MYVHFLVLVSILLGVFLSSISRRYAYVLLDVLEISLFHIYFPYIPGVIPYYFIIDMPGLTLFLVYSSVIPYYSITPLSCAMTMKQEPIFSLLNVFLFTFITIIFRVCILLFVCRNIGCHFLRRRACLIVQFSRFGDYNPFPRFDRMDLISLVPLVLYWVLYSC